MSEMSERVTAAVKAELGRQLNARPLHGDISSTDWHASGGSIDLAALVRVGMEAMTMPSREVLNCRPPFMTVGDARSMWSAMIDAARRRTSPIVIKCRNAQMAETADIQIKSIEDSFTDWESHVFGFGYGSGEEHTIPALKRFLELCPEDAGYDYQVLEKELGATVAWLLINILAKARILEYGSSPRFAWLTEQGLALKAFCASKTVEELYALTCKDEDYDICYPDACNHGPTGYVEGRKCINPFW
jgi:hypothetical protein